MQPDPRLLLPLRAQLWTAVWVLVVPLGLARLVRHPPLVREGQGLEERLGMGAHSWTVAKRQRN